MNDVETGGKWLIREQLEGSLLTARVASGMEAA
jgi:hypothetical protein